MTVNTSSLQTQFDADLARGYRGARVDPEPNESYSQETDPTTSPRALRYRQFQIDEFADPNNPDIANIHGRQGLVTGSAEELATHNSTQSITVPAHATAGTGQTTVDDDGVDFDGTVTAATFTPASTITGSGTNYRTFALQNHSKSDRVVGTLDTTSTRTGSAAASFTLSGTAANLKVSEGDVLRVVETTAGTGVANPGGTVAVTVHR